MPRYFIKLLYNGSNYNGWQSQKNTANTIQEVINTKLSILLGSDTEVVGCGRTDTGVHAKKYYAHFDGSKSDLHQAQNNLVYKLNKILPLDIAIINLFPVNENASARFDATHRTYEYYIHRQKNPFLVNASLYVFGELDMDLMNEAAAHFLTVWDFTSFSKLNTQNKTNMCTVIEARWIKINEVQYMFTITANRFLRNMVRAIVGTLLDVGRKKISLQNFKAIVEMQDRSSAGMSVPAHALYLVDVQYPKTFFNGE